MTVRTVAFLTQDFTPNTRPPLPGGCAYYRCFLPMQAVGVDARMGYPAWTSEAGFGVCRLRRLRSLVSTLWC